MTNRVAIRRRRWLLPVLVGPLLLLLIAALPQAAWSQDSRSVTWDRYDVTIEVRDDGSFHVTERMVVDFSGGPFTYGYADIPLGRVEEITNVAVSEETETGLTPFEEVDQGSFAREPQTFFAEPSASDELRIEYGFAPTHDQSRTFVLAYDAVGALRVYPVEDPPNEQVYWNAISTDVTEIAPIRAALVTIELPEPVDPTQVVLGEDTPGPAAERTADGQTWRWELSSLDRGDDFVARMQFPPITQAAPPAWQAADDRQREQEERERRRHAILAVVFLATGALGLNGGGFWLYRTWYTKGRDPHVGLVAEYLTEPPDDLAPGLAGTLVDMHARTAELVATLLDLARRGFLTIEQTGKDQFLVRAQEAAGTKALLPYERSLLDALFPSFKPGAVADLGAIRRSLSKQSSRIQANMKDELVQRGYIERMPKEMRRRWTWLGSGLLGSAVLASAVLSGPVGWPIYILAVCLGIGGIAVLMVRSVMSRRSVQGAESAARWRAFGRYLEGIERFADASPLAQNPDLFERYLPYATALGHDKHWVQVFAKAGAPAPRWYVYPGGQVWHDTPSRRASAGRSSAGSGGGDSARIPSPQAMSDGAMRSLSAVSTGMFAFLNTASTAFTPPSSSGSSGGFSGGGGGGGGGGSRGFG